MGYKLFINKINYFLLCPFVSFLATFLDEVKIDLGDKIRTKLSGSTFTCHKSGNHPKPCILAYVGGTGSCEPIKIIFGSYI